MRVLARTAAIDALIKAGRVEVATAVAEAAIEAGEVSPIAFSLTAHALGGAGRPDKAIERLRQGLAHFPDNVELSSLIGVFQARLGRNEEAKATLEAVLERAPDSATVRFTLGAIYAAESRVDEAAVHLKRAIELAPGAAVARDFGAEVAARRGDYAQAEAWVRPAAAAESPTVALTLARIEAHRVGPEQAEPRLRELLQRPLTVDMRSDVLTLLGDLLDGQGRAPEAFEVYAARNAMLREARAPAWRALSDQLTLRPDRLTSWLETRVPPGPLRGGPGAPIAGHIFLMSFPRSGSTLLEQVLASHPDVVALEEAPTLLEAETAFFIEAGGLERLDRLDEDAAAAFRAAYWRRVRSGGVDPDGKVFLDKMPSNTLVLPIIADLFPDAKVLFALRDPRDVVLSCFRRAFTANPITYQLLDLEAGAGLYAKVMAFAEVCRRTLPLAVKDVVYERLVVDLEGGTRELCAFLGLDWSPALLDFRATAQRRSIRTPSARQVRGGLFSGEGQWRAYRSQMAAVEPILKPWIERFGYPVD